MKIERISENQIRCTLNKHDLMERHLKISELAYGSEKAKDLFRDMMEQANIDFGFDADDIPLMIEAIPTSRESVVLVITKVDDPEEFDKRFSRFGIQGDDFEEVVDADTDFDMPEEEDTSIIDCLGHLQEYIENAEADEGADTRSSEFIPLKDALKKCLDTAKEAAPKKAAEDIRSNLRVFSFLSLNPIIQAAQVINTEYSGKNSIWKDTAKKRYYLLLSRGSTNVTTFHAVCSVLSEYGKEEIATYASQDYLNEHFQVIIKDRALSQLSEL